ncbi:MAG: Dipeptide transport system permease protein DppB, partial [uncultured Thermomicrobiales bacterium]
GIVGLCRPPSGALRRRAGDGQRRHLLPRPRAPRRPVELGDQRTAGEQSGGPSRVREAVGLRPAVARPVPLLRPQSAPGRPGRVDRQAAPGQRRAEAARAGDDRADPLRDGIRRPGRGAARDRLRRPPRPLAGPPRPLPDLDRDLGPRLLARPPAALRLFLPSPMAARSGASRRRDAPPRDDHGDGDARRAAGARLGRARDRPEAPRPAGDRARRVRDGDRRPDAPLLAALRARRRLRADRPGEGIGRAAGGCRSRPPQCPDPDGHRPRPDRRQPARRSGPHGDDLLLAGRGQLRGRRGAQARLPGTAGGHPCRRRRLRPGQPARRHRLRHPRPPHPRGL